MDLLKGATEAREWVEFIKTGEDAKRPDYYRLKDGAPTWMDSLVDAAHDGESYDDFTFEFIDDMLAALIDHDGDEEGTADDIVAEHRTYKLLEWLASGRTSLVDEYVEENGLPRPFTIDGVLQSAQADEMRTVLSRICRFIENELEDEDTDAE